MTDREYLEEGDRVEFLILVRVDLFRHPPGEENCEHHVEAGPGLIGTVDMINSPDCVDFVVEMEHDPSWDDCACRDRCGGGEVVECRVLLTAPNSDVNGNFVRKIEEN